MQSVSDMARWHLVPSLCLLSAGCVGEVGAVEGGGDEQSPPEPSGPGPGGAPAPASSAPGAGGSGGSPTVPTAPRGADYLLHRLTRDELQATLRDLVALPVDIAADHLPEDGADPFTHDLGSLGPTSTFVYGISRVAEEAARRAVSTPAVRRTILPCTTQDSACLAQFVAGFGKRAFRRPLTSEEGAAYRTLAADALAQASFDVAVEVLLRAFLSSPAFLYRSELGSGPAAGPTVRLTPHEVAARLSYLLLGTTPDDSLLKMGDDGSIARAADRLARARALIAEPRAAAQILRFHAEWLGYARMPHDPTVAAAYRGESDLLIAEVILRKRSGWPGLFQVRGAPGIPGLSGVYGVTLPANEQTWTELPAQRRGILSRAAFLSVGAKDADTSPTARGKLIRERLLCQEIPPPPPDAETDVPPRTAGACKADRYAAHRTRPACAGCHAQMDPIGFGLESFDQLGRYRTVELDDGGKPIPACPIPGTGELVGIGAFSGAAGLSDLLLADERLEACMTRQFLRFALGRKQFSVEEPLFDRVFGRYKEASRSFTELVLAYVASDEFVTARLAGRP